VRNCCAVFIAAKNQKNVKTGDMERGYLSYSKKGKGKGYGECHVVVKYLKYLSTKPYCRVYDSRHLQADCQEPGSAPEPYARSTFTFFAVA